MAKLPPALGPSLLVAMLLGAPRAHADEPAPAAPKTPVARSASLPLPLPTPPPISPPPVIWYGWEMLISGAAAYLLPLAVLKNDPETGLFLGALLSPFTTMSMHMLHGDDVKAYVSLPLSYAMIAGGGALAAKLECGPTSKSGCVASAVFTGMILGGLGAIVLDAGALAWGRPALAPPVKKAVLWPSVAPLPGGATVGIGGTF